jgi:hypothetical protein
MGRLRARRRSAAILALGLLVVAGGCSGTDGDPATGTEAMTSRPVDDAEAAGDAEPDRLTLADQADAEAEEDDGPAVVGPIGPFTGLPIDAELVDRPALIVKVDNHPRARPQTGLELADIVFDYRAEGVTRFAAVFHSETPEPVGPVRSSRTSDFDILRGFDNPLYASSGANDYVAAGLRSLPIVELTNRTRNEYFRDFSRPAPHNLYVNAADLYALAPDGLPAVRPWFRYRSSGDDLPDSATPAIGPVTIAYTGSPRVTHQWDEAVGGWQRTQDGAPHLTVAGDQLAPENVVILVTDYGISPADPISPEVRSVGGGPLVVLTGGHIITGRWDRPTPEDKPTLTDVDGVEIRLTPGRTWVLMPEEGQVSFAPGQEIDDGSDRAATDDGS